LNRLLFASLTLPNGIDAESVLLARSIRSFASALAGSAIWLFVPEPSDLLAPAAWQALAELDVAIYPAGLDSAALAFPLAAKVFAAAAAEERAAGQASLLAFLDADSLILQEPSALLLPASASLGCRPVDLALIGSRWDQPVDPFWALIYEHCGVSADRQWPVTTAVDQQVLRAYANAGLLVVRPERGLLRRWRDTFARLYLLPEFEPFYRQNPLYRIFMHQAVLAGVLMASLTADDMAILPPLVNYPLHLHARYPAATRPTSLNEVITCRYDTFFEDPNWRQAIHIDVPLRTWLDANAP
jgi:hypothetical protein